MINSLPDKPAVFASYLIRFKPIINKKFFKYFLHSPKYWSAVTDHKSGIAVPNVNATKLNSIEFRLPPNETQHRTVEKIEELFSELDNGVENLKKAQKQLKTYRQAVLKDAFGGKLTKEWREQQLAGTPSADDPVRAIHELPLQDRDDHQGNQPQRGLPTPDELLQQIKAERKAHRQRELAEWEKEVEQWETDDKPGRKPRKPRKAKELDPIGVEDLADLPEIPENWKYVRIGNIGNVGTGATPLKKEKSYYENGTIPWVTSGALNNEYVRKATDFVTEKALSETNLSLFPKQTLLVAMYGEGKTRGKCSELLIEATTNQAIAAIVQNEVERKTKDFLKYFLLKNYNDIRRMSSGGVQPNLNLGIIENTIVPLAPEQEQKVIVNEIDSRLSVVDQLEQTIKENLLKAEALRQSILKKAFGGELV
ncbi:MAG: restriction endonuclease subunit S [Balneolaceae bacterium]|nr:restriction endonuclease subunit S [Balneolaceae bacterium]